MRSSINSSSLPVLGILIRSSTALFRTWSCSTPGAALPLWECPSAGIGNGVLAASRCSTRLGNAPHYRSPILTRLRRMRHRCFVPGIPVTVMPFPTRSHYSPGSFPFVQIPGMSCRPVQSDHVGRVSQPGPPRPEDGREPRPNPKSASPRGGPWGAGSAGPRWMSMVGTPDSSKLRAAPPSTTPAPHQSAMGIDLAPRHVYSARGIHPTLLAQGHGHHARRRWVFRDSRARCEHGFPRLPEPRRRNRSLPNHVPGPRASLSEVVELHRQVGTGGALLPSSLYQYPGSDNEMARNLLSWFGPSTCCAHSLAMRVSNQIHPFADRRSPLKEGQTLSHEKKGTGGGRGSTSTIARTHLIAVEECA
jgi:hypothetical protein